MSGTSFGDLPPEYAGYEGAAVVVLPIPYDLSSSWMKGADGGPDAIIAASAHMELYDIETGSEVFRRGIHTAPPLVADSAETLVRESRSRAQTLIRDGKFVSALGGEHTVSVGLIRAHHEAYPGLSVLHLDAHGDRRQEYEGDPLSHACVMARAAESVTNIVSVGIRSMDASERASLDPARVFFAHEIQGSEEWIARAVSLLSDDVYLTIDLDVFDPGIMPSTGTPEPGGMGWYPVLRLLRAVAAARRIVGMDIVELCPSEADRAPDFMAAKLLYTVLTYVFEGSSPRRRTV